MFWFESGARPERGERRGGGAQEEKLLQLRQLAQLFDVRDLVATEVFIKYHNTASTPPVCPGVLVRKWRLTRQEGEKGGRT